jgi:hypothetical protein
VGFSFVRRCVSSPEIIPIKPRCTVVICPGPSPQRERLCTDIPRLTPIRYVRRKRMRYMPIRCTEWQEPVSLLRDERLLKRTGPTSLRTQ